MPLAGTTPLEILLKYTDPALVSFEMDVGWVVAAGGDPFALMKAHADLHNGDVHYTAAGSAVQADQVVKFLDPMLLSHGMAAPN